MGIFDPKVDANISPEQQVSGGASALQVGAGILGTALNAFGDGLKVAAAGAPTAGQLKDANQGVQIAGLSRGLAKVNALREQGKSREADALEMKIKANAALDQVDFSDPSVQAAIEAGTGRPADEFGFTQDQIEANKMMKTPEFTRAYATVRATNSELTNEQATEQALSRMMANATNEARIQDVNLAWDGGKRDGWYGTLQNTITETRGLMATLSENNQILSGQDFRTLKAGWGVERNRLINALPHDLKGEERTRAMAEIERMDNVVKTIDETFEGQDVIQSRLVEGLTTTLLDSKLSDGQKFLGISMLKNPENYENLVGTKEVADTMFGTRDQAGILSSTDGNPVQSVQFANLSDPAVNTEVPEGATTINTFDPETVDQLEGLTAEELSKRSGDQVSVLGQLKSNNADPASRADRAGIITQVFTETYGVPTGTGDYLSGEALTQRLGPNMVAEVDDIATYAPQVAGTLASQAYQAADANGAVIAEQLDVYLRDVEGLSVAEGRVVVDGTALDRLGVSDRAKTALTAAADRYYGGDMVALFADSGKKASAMQGEDGDMMRALRGNSLYQKVNNEVADANALLKSLQVATKLKTQWQERAQKYGVEPVVVGAQVEPEAATAEEAPVANTDVANIVGYDEIAGDTEFLAANKRAADNLGITEDALLSAISFETVGTFKADIKNPNSTATGLIQFLESTAKDLGTTTKALSKMTRTEQMKYVEKYLAPYKGKMKDAGDVYMAIHWPAAIGKDDSYVMYEEGSKAYRDNKNLDVNGDGTVTRGETLARLASVNGGTTSRSMKDVSANADAQTSVEQGATPETQSKDDLVEVAIAEADAYRMKKVNQAEQEGDAARGGPAAIPNAPTMDDVGRSVARQQDDAAMAKLVDEKLTPEQKQQLQQLGVRPEEVVYFKDEKAAKAALEAGEVEEGTIYVTDTGNVWRL